MSRVETRSGGRRVEAKISTTRAAVDSTTSPKKATAKTRSTRSKSEKETRSKIQSQEEEVKIKIRGRKIETDESTKSKNNKVKKVKVSLPQREKQVNKMDDDDDNNKFEEKFEAPLKKKKPSTKPAIKTLLKNVDMNKEECFHSGFVRQESDSGERSTVETDLWLKYIICGEKKYLDLEIVEIDYSEFLNPQVPNNTLTHMVRNAHELYKDMPTGRNIRMCVPIEDAKPVSLVTVEVEASAAKWFHRPKRMYGPFGELGGPWEPMLEPPYEGYIRLLFKDRAAYKRFGLIPPPPQQPHGKKAPSLKPQISFRKRSSIDTGVRTIPMALIDAALDEDCTCMQENPKYPNSKSYDLYEEYKKGTTLRELLKLGARRADLSNDIARGYIVLDDPAAQQDMISQALQYEAEGKRKLSSQQYDDDDDDDQADYQSYNPTQKIISNDKQFKRRYTDDDVDDNNRTDSHKRSKIAKDNQSQGRRPRRRATSISLRYREVENGEDENQDDYSDDHN
mmetsp:Transcript_15440/g.23235  ORF Transcript_15440/g.23235 Transcript_15440/m.23235 type:complete len:508 (+) Transcript_15440:83-1606(+)